MTREAVQDLVERPFAALVAQLEAGRSDTLKAYLAAVGRFHRYSWTNQFLIASQRPEATRVAGFQTWRGLNRWVRRGEKGIAIIAPIVRREREQADPLDTDTRTAAAGFRAAYVFDVAQTEGKPLPDLERTADGDPHGHTAVLEQAVRNAGVVLAEVDDLGGAHGVSIPGGIQILSTLGACDRFATLAHEFAHELLHRRGDDRPTCKTVRETEAEAVAYIVCSAVGVQPSVAASDYIGLYDGSADTLRASLARIQAAARTIIDAVVVAPSSPSC